MTVAQQKSLNMTPDEFDLMKNKFLRVCNICDSVKPPRVHHCRQCERCVIRMDHHCPWVGTCVGLGNQKTFLLFCIYVLITSLYLFVNFATTLLVCYLGDGTKCQLPQKWLFGTFKYCALVSTILALLFGLFCFIMLYDQIRLIKKGTSTIDEMKNDQ